MPSVYPFRAVTFATSGDLSGLVAPPYDVLDAAGKAALLLKDPGNIVSIDLPHVPAKELGPPESYEAAGRAFRQMLAQGRLVRSPKPVMFAYRQTFPAADGRSTLQRRGMACCVQTLPFGPRPGGGVLPHEETFSGPKEDRMALMSATKAQLSPIFGLHADEDGRAAALLQRLTGARPPDVRATTADQTLHECWIVRDEASMSQYQAALTGQDVFIADGHHRYTTALAYAKRVLAESGGAVGEDHPSRRCMMVLVSMSDPGLMIRPTHRVLGGMAAYSFEAFVKASEKLLIIRPAPGPGVNIEREMNACTLPPAPWPRNVFGLYDYATGRSFTVTLAQADPLQRTHPEKPRAWRELDVAIVQHAIVEQICQPVLNGGAPVEWAFPHSVEDALSIGSEGAGKGAAPVGFRPQLAILVRPTPLESVREISQAGVLMPQKSTFFYPKLATGLFMNLLEP